ncbi:polysaccharide deacetylase family protein [Streptomyces sp. CT34]|uniref:polysaccharide deacetylase family protein n=1 Tax=Streptomyces sp. CT34 TaxID=1553907 RepID=UPI00099CE665|nr:polysaccharide deacetylase family protein [Streptomyces sp. CT34]
MTRRLLLRTAVVIGTLATVRGLLSLGDAAPPPGSGPQTRGRPPAGAPGSAPPDGYRPRPLDGETSRSGPGASPPHADVACTVPAGAGRIALTFDDGPDPRHTPEILEVLRRHGTPATFFVVGQSAVAFPDLLRSIADEGHAVGNHTWTHPQLTTLPPGRVRAELGRTGALIEEVLGTAPRLARAPYGDWDQASLDICDDLGMSAVGWSVDSRDWTRPGPESIADTVLDELRPGAIVLSHDGGGNRVETARALDRYLPRLLDGGFRPVRITP